MWLAAPARAEAYIGETPCYDALLGAEMWMENHITLDDELPPEPVREAAALLAAVIHVNPQAASDEAHVPNMIRLMVLPWTRGR